MNKYLSLVILCLGIHVSPTTTLHASHAIDPAIFSAIRKRDTAALDQLLTAQNYQHDVSADFFSQELFEYLFEELADAVYCQSEVDGNTDKMHQALQKGADISQVFIKHNLNVNVTMAQSSNVTPLMIAVWQGFAPIVKALLDAGADAHACDAMGNRVVDYALANTCPFALKGAFGKSVTVDSSGWMMMACIKAAYNFSGTYEACVKLLEAHNHEDYSSIIRLIKAGRSVPFWFNICIAPNDNDGDGAQTVLKTYMEIVLNKIDPTTINPIRAELIAIQEKMRKSEESPAPIEQLIYQELYNRTLFKIIKMIADEGMLTADHNDLVIAYQELWSFKVSPILRSPAPAKLRDLFFTQEQIASLEAIDDTILARMTLRVMNFTLFNIDVIDPVIEKNDNIIERLPSEQQEEWLRKAKQELVEMAIKQAKYETNNALSEPEKFQLFKLAIRRSPFLQLLPSDTRPEMPT